MRLYCNMFGHDWMESHFLTSLAVQSGLPAMPYYICRRCESAGSK